MDDWTRIYNIIIRIKKTLYCIAGEVSTRKMLIFYMKSRNNNIIIMICVKKRVKRSMIYN